MKKAKKIPAYPSPSRATMGGKSRRSPLAFEEALSLLKAEIEKEGFWLLAEIDPQKLALKAGHEIPPARQLLFFHPDYLLRLLEASPEALIEVPLKLAILDLAEGGVLVSHTRPSEILAPYPGLSDLAEELEAKVKAIIGCLG
jgi:uncharacterized protein (DUF302 family)